MSVFAATVPPAMMTLDQASIGDLLVIQSIEDPQTAMMAIRLGISQGEVIELTSKIPGGPLVIRRGKVDIALGRDLCQGIAVQRMSA